MDDTRGWAAIGQYVQVGIPELRDHDMLALTPEGLLLLVHKPERTTVRLLTRLTRQLTQLPPLTTLLSPEDHNSLSRINIEMDCRAWGSGVVDDDSTVVLCFDRLDMLGVANPGDDHWTLLEYDKDGITTAPIVFGGRFYYFNPNGVMVLVTGADQPPRLEVVAASGNIRVSSHEDSVQLVVNNFGELMLVHRQDGFSSDKSYWRCNMYRVDLDTGTLFPVKSLGGAGRALFMGMYSSVSVSLEVFPSGSVSADTIYMSFDADERRLLKVGAYHLADGTIDPPCSYVQRPFTLADCLTLSKTVRDVNYLSLPNADRGIIPVPRIN